MSEDTGDKQGPSEDTPQSKDGTGEMMNLPFANADGKTEVPLKKSPSIPPKKISISKDDGFERIHDWDHYTREVLDNILSAIESKQQLGYFDSLIDVDTNCKLIIMARAIYIDLFNKDGSRFKNPHMQISKVNIDGCMKGGYSTEYKERLYKALMNN